MHRRHAVWAYMAAAVVLQQLSAGSALPDHRLAKRSYDEILCKGVYDRSIFARVDRICEDCYNLFREPHLHTLCRSQCYANDYFPGCIDALLKDDKPKLLRMAEFLGRK